MKLSEIIKQYRSETGMSMDKFASKCGLSKGYISMIENGINSRNKLPISPTLTSLKKIAYGLGTDVDELLKIMDAEETVSLISDLSEINSDTDKNTLSDREQSHIQVYRDLSDGGKDKVDHYTDTVRSMERQESDSDIVDRFRKRFVARNGNKNLSPDQMRTIMDILDDADDD